jgi:predicted nucleotidyltransferase
MGQKFTNMDKIIELFYENPSKSFTVREISSKTKIPKSTVHKYITQLKKEKMITEENQASDSNLFKTKKTFHYIEKMIKIGLLDQIEKELNPSCIILFGSFRKGESDKDSDIDIFIESSKREINLKNFEEKLGHEIQLIIENDIHKLPDRLFNNVINGIKIGGYFKAK